MPFGSNFVDLAVYCIGTANAWTKFLAFMMGSSYVAFTLWWLALSYLAFPRILFAWGMDRMGPKWFTDINPRFASPVKNHILCLVLGEALLVVYYAWLTDQMQNIVVTGMQITSVFIPTAIAALLFPYMKRCKGVWDTSPYNKWNFLGLPVVVWGALVDLVYLVILLYYFIVNNAATATFTTAVDHPVHRRVGAGRRLVLHLEISSTRPGRVSTSPSPTASCRPSDRLSRFPDSWMVVLCGAAA